MLNSVCASDHISLCCVCNKSTARSGFVVMVTMLASVYALVMQGLMWYVNTEVPKMDILQSSDLIWLYRYNTTKIHIKPWSNRNPILVPVGCHLVPTKYVTVSCQVRFICDLLSVPTAAFYIWFAIIPVSVSMTPLPLRLCLLTCDATGSLNQDCRVRHICAEVTCVKIRMESDSDHLQRWVESLDEIR